MNKTFLYLVSFVALAAAGCTVGAAGDAPGDDIDAEQEETEAPPEDVGAAASADMWATTFMNLTIGTGSDDLRSSSTVYLSAQHADGTWSSEYPIMSGASAWSTTNVRIDSAWDGYDFCALRFRLRLQQGSCFGCTSDNWDVSSMTVTLTSLGTGTGTLVSQGTVARLTESGPTVQVAATIPAGTRCLNNTVIADCNGALVNPSTAAVWEQDTYCDNGYYGMNLVCSAFEFDNGACGLPPAWTCSSSYYHAGASDGCDCNCSAWDPDCNDPAVNVGTRVVYGCSAGAVCYNKRVNPGVYAPACITPSQPPQ